MHWLLRFILEMKLHVSESSSVHHQELFTVHSAMVYVIQFADSFRAGSLHFHPAPARKLSVIWMTYTIAECTVNNSWWWTEELSETCRVSFPK
jgi:ABC-type phosphate/phosphonate transport system substrate-binding protein